MQKESKKDEKTWLELLSKNFDGTERMNLSLTRFERHASRRTQVKRGLKARSRALEIKRVEKREKT